MNERQELIAGNYSNNLNPSNQFAMAEMGQYPNYAYSQFPPQAFSNNPAENQQMSELHSQMPPNGVSEYEQAYYHHQQQNQSQLLHQPPAQPFQKYPSPSNFCIYPQPLPQGSVNQREQICFDTESPLLSSNMLGHAPLNRETTVEEPYDPQYNNNPMFIPRSSVKNEYIDEHPSSMVLPCTISSFQDADESSMQHSSHYQNLEQARKTSIYSHPSNYASTCPSNNSGSRYSIGAIQDTSLYQIPISLTYSTTPTNIQSSSIPRFDTQPPQQQFGPAPYRPICECNSPYGCQIHNGNGLSQPYQHIPVQSHQLPSFPSKGIKIEQEEISKGNYQNQNKVTLSIGPYLVKQESVTEGKRISFDSGDSKGRTRVLSVPMTNSRVIEDEDSENEEQTSSSSENINPAEINVKKEESNTGGVAGVAPENKVSSTKLKGTSLSSNKSIKKTYKPKKKYKQSRQKNVFKNFGNALMNSIQNNFVIRDQIEKRLVSTALIEAFHVEFLKNQLNHLKNKEDFLQGWRTSDTPEDPQLSLFKSIFKEVSMKFFEEYAEKYVNESDKLKNKDIHIKAIPIFKRGIQDVSELQKFKLS